ncbi:unnamed protein product [Penicillium bialowiezense]
MSGHRSTWSKFCSWRHRGEKGKGKDNNSLAIHGSCAGRPSVHNQVPTAPVLDTGTASASPAQQTPEPVSQAQVSQEPPSDQPSAKSSHPKPYAENYDLWEEALNSLEEEERSNVKALLKDWDHDHPKRKDLVGEIQATMDGALKSKHHDRTTSIGKLLSVLDKFLSAGDVVVSFDPTHAALPWAAVRCTIVMFTAHNELKGVILTGMAEVTSLLVRCDMYQLLYMAPDPTLRPPEDVLAKLRTCILQTYAGLQSFFAFVERQQRSLKIGDVFKLEDARSHIDKLSGSQKQLLQAADDCEKSCDLSSRSDLKELLGLSSEIPIIRQQVDLVLERIDARDERDILEWISHVPYGTHHRVRVESRTPETCEWLLQTKEFCEWMDYGSSAILRLQGSMGAGKTYLTSKVIDHVRGLLESSSDHAGFAFFYCNRNEENRRSPLSVLQSYVRQLSTAVGSNGHIRKKLKIVSNETRLQGSHLGFDACKTQLMESINEYSQTVIILDALDECDDYSRWQLIDVIRDLASKSDRPLKVFISSRPESDIKARFSGKNIEIQAINNQGDIEKFVNAEIDKPRRWGPISADLRSEIVQVLCEDSQGMFQWAYLQIQQVLKLSTPADIKIRLGKLPEGLEAAYQEIYEEISSSEHRKALVDRACKWVISSCAPLSSDELLFAVRIDADGASINCEDQLNESELLDRCSNLLVIDPETQLWGLSHLSVREYFERNHWGPREIHSHTAKVCLKLLIEMYKSPAQESDKESSSHAHNIEPPSNLGLLYPLEEYVLHHWVIHIGIYEDQITADGPKADSWLADLLKRFLGSPNNSSPQYRAWYRSLPLNLFGTRQSSFLSRVGKMQISPEEVTISTMCRFSIYVLLRDWWENAEITFSQVNDEGAATLELAATAGCEPICKIIIKRVVSTHLTLPASFYGAALVAAAGSGCLETAQMLLEHGTDVNFAMSERGLDSPLISAAQRGSLADVEFFLRNGADVNLSLPGEGYGSALIAAASEGAIEIVKILIENGADVNLPLTVGSYGSALAAASYMGKTAMVKTLIEIGADVNLKLISGHFGSALAAAAWEGKIEIMRILIENGADVNLELIGGYYGSALTAAAIWRANIEIVRILIENGADVNLKLISGHFGSALAAAACEGKMAMVKTLIENGANVNLKLISGRFGSALAAAAWEENIEIMRILIENGADVNLKLINGSYGSALITAAGKGRTEAVELLIEKGADVNLLPPGSGRMNALAAAADGSHEEIEKILVDHGATMNLVLSS